MRDAHRLFPNALAPTAEEVDAALVQPPVVEFTGEEGNGRYVDLHALYATYVNSPFGSKLDYLAFLDALSDGAGFVGSVPRSKKWGPAYRSFLDALVAALLDWHSRARPLSYAGGALAAGEQAFEEAWQAGRVAGWEDKGVAAGTQPADGALDLEAFSSAEVRACSSSRTAPPI